MAQNCSNGPASQTPSFAESLSGGVFGVHVPSAQSFGCVVLPNRPQAPPGHSELFTHGAPLFAPLLHRLPPQIPGLPPLIGQSALVAQGSALVLLQVSQKHFTLVKPGDVQFGLPLVNVRVVVPVLRLSVSLRLPTFAPGSGGQS